MNRPWTATPAVLAALSLLAITGDAAAQFYPTPYSSRPAAGPYQPRATLSPYLNLLRGGNPAANYYLGVIPEINQRAINAQVGSAILNLERRTAPAPAELAAVEEALPTLPSTGHPTAFGNSGGYFGGAQRTGSPLRAGGVPAPRKAPTGPSRAAVGAAVGGAIAPAPR